MCPGHECDGLGLKGVVAHFVDAFLQATETVLYRAKNRVMDASIPFIFWS